MADHRPPLEIEGAATFHLLGGTKECPYGHSIHNPYAALPQMVICRHGLSQSNHDPRIRSEIPSPAVNLMPEGRRQAEELAVFLMDYIRTWKWRTFLVVTTPMPRTLQTAQPLLDLLQVKGNGLDVLREEADALREIDVGMYPHGVTPPPGVVNALDIENRYRRHVDHGMGHFSPYYHGESALMVADRVRNWLLTKMVAGGPMFASLDGIIVYGHGVTNKILRMCLTGSDWTSYHNQPHPENCSALHIRKGSDRGIIFSPRAPE